MIEPSAREHSDPNVSAMGVIRRLWWLDDRLQTDMNAICTAAGLTTGQCQVLVTLRRAAPPHELSPGQIAVATRVTSGAVTKRVDRLHSLKLVACTVSIKDARCRRIRLTDDGQILSDELIGLQNAVAHRLLAGLSELERAQLVDLLEVWSHRLGARGHLW